jgi:hypothetical protein
MPHLDSDVTTAYFLKMLARADRYLEYGTGASTLWAARFGVDLVGVDSDRNWLDALRRKILDAGCAQPNQVLRFSDIGQTGKWGKPVGDVDDARLELFRHYSDPPEACGDALPDLVLVDGRFRVACTLKALKMLSGHRDWTILVDDYTDRSEYHVLDDYAHMTFVGRMAVITEPKPVTDHAFDRAIRQWEPIPA